MEESVESSSIYVLHKSQGESYSGESSRVFFKSGAGDQISSEKVSIIEDDTPYGFTLVTTKRNNEIVHFSKPFPGQLGKYHDGGDNGDFEILDKAELEIEDKWFTIDLPSSSSGNSSKNSGKEPASPRMNCSSSEKFSPLPPLADPPTENEWKYRYSNEPIPITSLLIKNQNWSEKVETSASLIEALTESECEGEAPLMFTVDGYYETTKQTENKKCCPFF